MGVEQILILPSIVVTAVGKEKMDQLISDMDRATNEWEARAARGECGWVCSDCCQSFHEGMPDACCCGHQSCTDIILGTKAQAWANKPEDQQ